MKKLFAVLMMCLMLTVCVLPVSAEISPTAPTVTKPGNDSPQAPQTGDTWVYVAAATLAVGTVGVITASKKLASEN